MREIFVVTHPEASHHVEDLVGGWHDSELTERGREDARRIGAALAGRVRPGVQLFSSSLRRCLSTAEAIGEAVGAVPVPVRELREKSYGEGDGSPEAWFRPRFVPPPRFDDRMGHAEGLEGAETKLEWARRVYRGMEGILALEGEQIIIVTHGGTATPVIAHWLGMPLEALAYAHFAVDSGSITTLVEDDYFFNHSLARLNDTSHVPG